MRYLLFIITLLLFSCASKKVNDTQVRETITEKGVYKETVFLAAQRDVMKIDVLCDTLTREKPLEVTRTIVRGSDTISLYIKNNQLLLEVSNSMSLISEKDSIIESIKDRKESVKEIIKYRIPSWVWVLILILVLVVFILIRTWRFL